MANDVKDPLTLDRALPYQVKVPGCLGESWLDWKDGMTITAGTDHDGLPVTTLTGTFDQAALQGLLHRIYSVGVPLISVHLLGRQSESDNVS
jgi:hypothetical protein